MGIANPNRRTAALAAATPMLLSLLLVGCASSTDSSLMDARAQALAPPNTSAFLPVEDMTMGREGHAMTAEERSTLKKELIAARDRQTAAAKTQGSPAKVEPEKPR